MTDVRVGVLVSGSGTILQAMFDAGLPVTTVISDRPCAALALAAAHGAADELVDRSGYGGFGPGFDRQGYTATVAATLVAHQVDLVAMAGFGTVLTETIHYAFPDRVLNTHPALLPAFPGWHGVRDALAAGVAETGCTVHLATLEMDAGPILAQAGRPGPGRRHRGDVARTDQGGRAGPVPGHRGLGPRRARGRTIDTTTRRRRASAARVPPVRSRSEERTT